MTLKVVTNNKPRAVKYGHEFSLKSKWRKDYDFLNREEFDCAQFVMYKKWLHYLGNFEWCKPRKDPELKGWEGIHTDSYSSGILLKYPDKRDLDYVIMGWFYVACAPIIPADETTEPLAAKAKERLNANGLISGQA